MSNFYNLSESISSISASLNKGEVRSVELCKKYLQRVAESEKDVNAFLETDESKILEWAKESDARRSAGQKLSLYDGIPVAIKANISVDGQSCGCASKILENYVSVYDASVIKKLKNVGMICFGRTNMDEFAMGSSTENSAYKASANPVNTNYVPGGSSGGSAVAVSCGAVPVALGSDTGGSIRQPASFCGVVGMKPTYGRVSRYGLVAFASSLDQIGPITTNVSDAALMLDIIGGHDDMDATSLPLPCDGFLDSLNKIPPAKNLKIGIPREYLASKALDKDVLERTNKAISLFKEAGAEIVDISLPLAEYAVAAYYVIATAEASANLQRFDGIRYGKRSENSDNLIETYKKTRSEGFGDEVKRRIILGTFVLSSGYYDAYYLRAQKARTLIKGDFAEAFKKCDIMLSPVSPTPAWKFGEKSKDPLEMYLADIYTISANLAGTCAISIPNGYSSNALPIGLQLTAEPLGEKKLLQTAKLFEDMRNLDKTQ